VSLRTFLAVWGTILVGLLLTVLHLPPGAAPWLGWLRPEWVAVGLLYWVMAVPQQVGMGTAWCAGLLVDSVTGDLLGQHALTLVFIAWAGLSLYERLRMYSLLQQALIVFVTLFVAGCFDLSVESVVRGEAWTPLLVLPPLVSAALWPLAFVLLRGLRRRLRIG
jgi:rod shape-determining protein MreD